MNGSTINFRTAWTKLGKISALAGFAVTALALAAPIALAPAPALAAGKAIVVKMHDEKPFYTPGKITIHAGDKVTWVNDGKTVHSVSTDSSEAANPHDVSSPKGTKPFDSGFLPPGGSFSYVFTVPGRYHYFCVPHEKAGMTGWVTVRR
ncbi:MAG: cupredoxin domain-containing protein [Candidatus Binataceae bacterium]